MWIVNIEWARIKAIDFGFLSDSKGVLVIHASSNCLGGWHCGASLLGKREVRTCSAFEEKFAGKLRHYSMDYSVGEPQDVTTAGSDAVKRQTVVSVSVNPPLAEEVVNGYFADVADKENPLEFTVTREGYEEGSEEAANDWDVVFNSEDTAAIEALAKKAQEIANSQTAFEASNIVGSSVAGYARTQGILAILGSLLCVIAYLWLRFKRAVYGLSAVVGVTHDVLVVLGLIGLSYFVAGALAFLGVTQFKIGLATVAAFLTLIGYSLNDTIVLFDRMREVRGKSEAITKDIINKACYGMIQILPPRYNIMPYGFLSEPAAQVYQNDPGLQRAYSFDEWNNCRLNPAIIHYATRRKPWNDLSVNYANLWWKTAKELPFHEEILRQSSINFK